MATVPSAKHPAADVDDGLPSSTTPALPASPAMPVHDESLAVRRLTGGLLIAVPVAFTAIFVALGAVFNYPDILDASTDEVLRSFAAEGGGLVALWYGFMLTAVMFAPIAVLLPRALGLRGALGAMSVVFGVLAAAVQFVGLARWPFLVPYLSDTYLDPQSTPAARDAAAVTFQAFHNYAGGALGEHLGYLFTAAWTLMLAEGIHRVLGAAVDRRTRRSQRARRRRGHAGATRDRGGRNRQRRGLQRLGPVARDRRRGAAAWPGGRASPACRPRW